MINAVIGFVKNIIGFFTGKQNEQTARAQTFVNSNGIDILLEYLVLVMIYNDIAYNFNWYQFVTSLDPIQSIATIGGLGTLRVGHHYFLNKS